MGSDDVEERDSAEIIRDAIDAEILQSIYDEAEYEAMIERVVYDILIYNADVRCLQRTDGRTKADPR